VAQHLLAVPNKTLVFKKGNTSMWLSFFISRSPFKDFTLTLSNVDNFGLPIAKKYSSVKFLP